MEEKTVKVPNISCGHCVTTIETEIGDIEGVSDVQGEQQTKSVKIYWDPDITDWVVIEEAMTEIDYAPEAAS